MPTDKWRNGMFEDEGFFRRYGRAGGGGWGTGLGRDPTEAAPLRSGDDRTDPEMEIEDLGGGLVRTHYPDGSYFEWWLGPGTGPGGLVWGVPRFGTLRPIGSRPAAPLTATERAALMRADWYRRHIRDILPGTEPEGPENGPAEGVQPWGERWKGTGSGGPQVAAPEAARHARGFETLAARTAREREAPAVTEMRPAANGPVVAYRPEAPHADVWTEDRPDGGVGVLGPIPREELRPTIMGAAKTYGIDPALIAGIIEQESSWDPTAESGVGAYGYMQLMPETARDMGVDRYSPPQNILGGAKYLRYLVDYYDEDLELALAAYNGGMGNVDRALQEYGRESFMQGMHPQTRAYVPIILAKRDQYRGYDPRR